MLKADKMGVPNAWFARRWTADFGCFSLRLHHWFGSDDPEALHDHPCWFVTIVLRGGYDDKHMTQDGWDIDRLRTGSIRFRAADYRHTVINRYASTWTLCLFGPPSRRWQFYSLKTGRRMKRDKYFAEIGHHTATGGRIRLRPDGSAIPICPQGPSTFAHEERCQDGLGLDFEAKVQPEPGASVPEGEPDA